MEISQRQHSEVDSLKIAAQPDCCCSQQLDQLISSLHFKRWVFYVCLFLIGSVKLKHLEKSVHARLSLVKQVAQDGRRKQPTHMRLDRVCETEAPIWSEQIHRLVDWVESFMDCIRQWREKSLYRRGYLIAAWWVLIFMPGTLSDLGLAIWCWMTIKERNRKLLSAIPSHHWRVGNIDIAYEQ